MLVCKLDGVKEILTSDLWMPSRPFEVCKVFTRVNKFHTCEHNTAVCESVMRVTHFHLTHSLRVCNLHVELHMCSLHTLRYLIRMSPSMVRIVNH